MEKSQPTIETCLNTIREICKEQNFSEDELKHRARLLYLLNRLKFWDEFPILLEEINYHRGKNFVSSDKLKQPDVMLSLPSDEEITEMGVKEYQDWTGADDRKVFIKIAMLVKKRMIEYLEKKRGNGA